MKRFWYLEKSPTQVSAHDCHPRKHGKCEKVSNITHHLTHERWKDVRSLVAEHQVQSETEYGHNITDNNLAMEILQLWYTDIHHECDNQEAAADHAQQGVDQSDDVGVSFQTTVIVINICHTAILSHKFAF